MNPALLIDMPGNRSNTATRLAGPAPETPGAHDKNVALTEEIRMHLRAIGHELRSPLTAFSLGIDLAQRDAASQARTFERMRSMVRRMDRMIEELLFTPRPDLGDTAVVRERVSVHVRRIKRR
jgi:signal transduction histidine kinase